MQEHSSKFDVEDAKRGFGMRTPSHEIFEADWHAQWFHGGRCLPALYSVRAAEMRGGGAACSRQELWLRDWPEAARLGSYTGEPAASRAAHSE